VDQNFSDNNFCVKGVVTAHRGLTPMAIEIKKVYQHIKTNYKGNNNIEIRNGYFFRSLDNVHLYWELLEDGKITEEGSLATINIAPQQSATISLPIKTNTKAGKEYFLNIRYRFKSAEPFLEKGYEIASEQFALNGKAFAAKPITSHRKLNAVQTKEKATLTGKDFSITFDLQNGTMRSYLLKGEQLLKQGPQPSFWRAPTDNDIGAGYNKSLRMWRNAYENGKTIEAKINTTATGYEIVFKKELANGEAIAEQLFSIYGDGAIKVENRFTPLKSSHKLLYRFGNDLQLNKNLDQIQFYGRGPWENYWDRKTASFIGLYKQTLDKQYFPYARPQESGNKSDVRWVMMTNKKGRGLRFELEDSLLNFSALPYSLDDLDPEMEKKQYHSGELAKRNEIYMHLDLQQSGVQGIDSWGSQPLEQYRSLSSAAI
jgi:beta-galactosidase